MRPNLQFSADLVAFTENVLNPSRPAPGGREKIDLNFYFNITSWNARGWKG